MTTATGTSTAVLDSYLEEILEHPGGDQDGLECGLWGSGQSYELQVLLLLELRFFPLDRQRLMRAYHSFFHPRFPAMGCRPLSALRTLPVSQLSRQLGDFRKHLEAFVTPV